MARPTLLESGRASAYAAHVVRPMGAFFLLRRTGPGFEARRDALLAEFDRQGFRDAQCFDAGQCVVYSYRKLSVDNENAHYVGADLFCLSVGTFFYRSQTGRVALEWFLREFDPQNVPWDDVCGQFCLIVAKAGAIHVLTDRIGLYKVYRSSDASLIASSFLAMVAVTSKLTIDAQSVYEYVLVGASFGNRTVFDQIELVDPDRVLLIRDDGVAATELAPVARDVRLDRIEDLLEINLHNLRRYFAMLASAFGNRISTGLSGGYDSRLMLALLRSVGVAPYVYVYGPESHCDVQVARLIAQGERFPLFHTDKDDCPKVERDGFPALLEANHRFFDGCPYGGIFDNGTDLQTRRERCRNGELTLNGMAGEMFRRPDLSNLSFSVRDVVWRYFCRFDPSSCTSRFREEAYCEAMGLKLRRALQFERDVLPRSDVTYAFAAFYDRYWSGGNVSINNRLSCALLPFCDLAIVRESVRLPIAHRHYGLFEAALIRAADPRLAGYSRATVTTSRLLPHSNWWCRIGEPPSGRPSATASRVRRAVRASAPTISSRSMSARRSTRRSRTCNDSSTSTGFPTHFSTIGCALSSICSRGAHPP